MGQGESRLKYQQAVLQLIDHSNLSPNEISFWAQFWTLPSTVDEVFSALNPADIRELKKKNPGNLALLINKVVGQLTGWVQRLKASDSKSSDFLPSLNCIRLITRIMPFLFEDQSDAFVEHVFWLNLPPLIDRTPENLEKLRARKNIEEEITVEGEPQGPLAIRLLDVLLQLLFMPNFTITSSQSPAPLAHVWAAGLGIEEGVLPSTRLMWQHRLEILKCILVCVSETLYLPADKAYGVPNRWIEHIVVTLGNKNPLYAESIFYSLMNVSCSYDPVGWGVPYNHIMFSDDQEAVASVSLQILNVFLNYIMRSDNPNEEQPNVFINYVRGLKRTNDFKFILGAFERFISNPIIASNTRLPYSMKQISFHQDMLMFIWRLFEENKKFLSYVVKSDRSPEIFNNLLYFMYTGRKDPAELGVVQLSTFIILLLSGERDYAVSLNKPLTNRPPLPDMPQFTGNYADLVILIVHRILTDSHPSLLPIYECLYTILANISPFVKGITMLTCGRLMKLFELISHPRQLFKSEHEHRSLHLLLEMFNNLIQYQYEGNSRFIYSILKAQNEFSKLAHLRIFSPPPIREIPGTASPQQPVEVPIEQPQHHQEQERGHGHESVVIAPAEEQVVPQEQGREEQLQEQPPQEQHQEPPQEQPPQEQHHEPPQEHQEQPPHQHQEQQLHDQPPQEQPQEEHREYQQEQPTQEHQEQPTQEHQKQSEEQPKEQVYQQEQPTAEQPHQELHQEQPPQEQPHQEQPPQEQPHQEQPQEQSPQHQPPQEQPQQAHEQPPPETVIREAPVSESPVNNAPQVVPPVPPHELAPAGPPVFIPTNEWLESWKRFLPLDNILRIITTLSPQIQSMCTGSSQQDEAHILEFLQRTTLVGLLPVPRPILIRQYQANIATHVWLLGYMWGAIYLQHSNPPLFLGSTVRLFVINTIRGTN